MARHLKRPKPTPFRVAELFAGVGGFRLGLEGLNHPDWAKWEGRDGAGMRVVWSNQWEPGTKTQHASDCYVQRFGSRGHDPRNIEVVLDELEHRPELIPEFDVLVGGFPCQDYSVAKTLSKAAGINGKKGVLWWQIYRLLEARRPKHVILENVDRLLKSPANQRGRDFAVMLWCFDALGYAVEWRVVNAADYGFPQRRRRVFIVAHRLDAVDIGDRLDWFERDGVLARAFPANYPPPSLAPHLEQYVSTAKHDLQRELAELSENFPGATKHSPFLSGGLMWKGETLTSPVEPMGAEPRGIGDVLLPLREVPPSFRIPEESLHRWRKLKDAKSEPRLGRDGFAYNYSEGAVAFPEPVERPSRTILTGEGGTSPSRFKLVVKQGRTFRRLTPVELERLNGFPDDWTNTGMPDTKRAFMMGNALVVGVVRKIGLALSALST